MSDLIRRQDVLALAEKGVLISNDNYEKVCKAINDIPSADITEKESKMLLDESDAILSRNRVLMYLADLQMATNPHTEAGQTAWSYLEMAFNGIKEMKGERKMNENRTDIEREFHESEAQFVFEAYTGDEPMVWRIDNVDTLAFNIWSFLTKAQPQFDEIRIRVATEEDIEDLEGAEGSDNDD